MSVEKLKCFKGEINPRLLDREPFHFSHKLADHPALSIENLATVISTLPKEKVMFSKGLNDLAINFDHALDADKKDIDLKEVIETIRTSNSYIAVRNPELHPSFHGLYKDLMEDVGALLKAHGTGSTPLEPMLWVFIASPNAITPFHFDRFSNIIMQIRGSKVLAVFPPRVEEIISAKDTEAYLDWSGELPPWRQELDGHAHKFHFKTGEAVHIPYVSGHYVKNGSEDISISLSFFFHSDETMRWSKAMKFNNRLRIFGIKPRPIGESTKMDFLKAALFPFAHRFMPLLKKITGQ